MTLRLLFLLLALIHAIPALAAVAPGSLTRLYGVPASDSALLTLLQHRAVLFGLLAAALVLAAFRPDIRWPALVAVTVSMASFLLVAALRGELSGSLRSIVVADAAGLLIALIAAILLLRS